MSKNLSTLFMALILLSLAGVSYGFLYRLEKQTIAEAERIFLETNKLRATVSKVALLQNESAGLEADEETLASFFAKTNDIVPFLKYLESSGVPYGTVVKVVSVSDVSPEGVMPIAIEIQGSFPDIRSTLASLEYGPYALSAESVTLERGTEGEWKLRGNFNALVETL